MEPAGAASLACNIIQLIEVAGKIVSNIRELRKSPSGLTADANRFAALAESGRNVIDRFIASPTTSKASEDLQNFAKSYQTTVNEHLEQLEKIRVKDPKSFFEPYKAGIKARWKKQQLEEGARAINQLGSQITMYIVTVYLPSMDTKLDDLHMQLARLDPQLAKEMECLKDIIRKQNDKDALLEAVNQWFCEQENLDSQRRCLQSLYFKNLRSREDDIKEAHRKTLRWLLNDESNESAHMESSKLWRWLSSKDTERNVFWISGIPGSGKSTLMKFLVQQDLMQTKLQEWVGDRQLIVAEYFFWSHGTPLQRSFRGLLQSLLFHILRKHRDLIALAFPSQGWKLGGNDYEFPMKELHDALQRIFAVASTRNLCFLFLIDGLDGFNERDLGHVDVPNESDLIDLLRDIYRWPAVKLCVSSRPLQPFAEVFYGNSENYLNIQELTKNDIIAYINETLMDNKAFRVLASENQCYKILVRTIQETAEGVFLWVYLVCKSLLAGITNGDHIEDLQQRLRELPPRLEDLYSHMLSGIEERYWKQTAQLLLVCSRQQDRRVWLLKLFFLEEYERSRIMSSETLSMQEEYKNYIKMRNRANARCRGLLDLPWLSPEEELPRMLIKTDSKWLDMVMRKQARLTHRTIADFLKTDAVRKNLIQRAHLQNGVEDISELEVRAAIASLRSVVLILNNPTNASSRSCIGRITSLEDHFPLHSEDFGEFRRFVESAEYSFWWCARAMTSSKGKKLLFDELDRATSCPIRGSRFTLLNIVVRCPYPILHPRIALAMHLQDWELVDEELKAMAAASVPFDGGQSLFMALTKWFDDSDLTADLTDEEVDSLREKLISIYFNHGVNPNAVFEGMTVWTAFLAEMISIHVGTFFGVGPDTRIKSLILLLLRHGADPLANCDLVCPKNIDSYFPKKPLCPAYRAREEFVGHEEVEILSFTAADVVRHIFKGVPFEEDKLLPQKTDDRATPQQVLPGWFSYNVS